MDIQQPAGEESQQLPPESNRGPDMPAGVSQPPASEEAAPLPGGESTLNSGGIPTEVPSPGKIDATPPPKSFEPGLPSAEVDEAGLPKPPEIIPPGPADATPPKETPAPQVDLSASQTPVGLESVVGGSPAEPQMPPAGTGEVTSQVDRQDREGEINSEMSKLLEELKLSLIELHRRLTEAQQRLNQIIMQDNPENSVDKNA